MNLFILSAFTIFLFRSIISYLGQYGYDVTLVTVVKSNVYIKYKQEFYIVLNIRS